MGISREIEVYRGSNELGLRAEEQPRLRKANDLVSLKRAHLLSFWIKLDNIVVILLTLLDFNLGSQAFINH